MKKIAMVTLLVLGVLVAGFAQEPVAPSLSVALSGGATTTFGYNLDQKAFGITNAVDAKLEFGVVAKDTREKGGEGAYGWIKFKEFEMKIDTTDKLTATAPTITAKIIAAPLWIMLFDDGSATKDFAPGNAMPNLTADNFVIGLSSQTSVKYAGLGYVGIGFDTDTFDAVLYVGAPNGYCGTTVNSANQLALLGDIDLAVAGVSLNLDAAYGLNYAAADTKLGLAVKAGYDVALNETIKVVPTVSFDYVMPMAAGAASAYDVGVGVFAKWGGTDTYNSYLFDSTTACPITWKEIDHNGGVGVGVTMTNDQVVDLVVQAVEQRGDAGLVPGLGAAVSFEMADVTAKTATTIGFGAFVNYKVGNITPYVKTNVVKAGTTLDVGLGAGVEVASIIPNTTLTVNYNNASLVATTAKQGVVEAAVKVAF